MGKYPIYAIVSLVFIGVVKLLQVTTFDVEKYNKNKKLSFAKPEDETEIPYKKEIKSEEIKQEDSTFQVVEETSTPTLEQSENDSAETESADADAFENQISESNSPIAYAGFADLKNIYLAPKIANLPPGQLREDVVIRYYRHDQDGDKIYSLKDLGYYIHEKEANETAGLGSNILYYGTGVNIEDIQIVAYALLEKGLPIKSIEPTQFSWKSNSIEIGTDSLLIENTTLSQADIQNFSK